MPKKWLILSARITELKRSVQEQEDRLSVHLQCGLVTLNYVTIDTKIFIVFDLTFIVMGGPLETIHTVFKTNTFPSVSREQ